MASARSRIFRTCCQFRGREELWRTWKMEGIGGAFLREFSSFVTRNINQQTLEEGNRMLDDEIAYVRDAFASVKRRFLEIPDALRQIPMKNPEGVYVNKNLKLADIRVYGFDYDYTLAHYSAKVQNLIYDTAKEYLVNELKYPDSVMESKYDNSFPIRGLCYDKFKGCLLKLDFFASIEPDGCYFGRRKLSRSEIDSLYGSRHIGHDQAQGLVRLMDFFCFSEACLIADIVQHFVDGNLEFDASNVYDDVRKAITHAHVSGLAHRKILSNPGKYLKKNEPLLHFLRVLRDNGKKLFLLTNSPYFFVDGGMCFMFEDSLGYQETWRELFDVVIAGAHKPEFYTSEHPFRCYDIEKDTLGFSRVDSFLPNKIYYHGCLKKFVEITNWKGPEVIYFGDHIFTDLRGPSKAGWRTAAIIHELENEIWIQNGDTYRFQQAKLHYIHDLLTRLLAAVGTSHPSSDYHSLVKDLNNERQNIRRSMRAMFNESFGAIFMTDTCQESAFAYHIHRYADVYTSKPENFLLYPPKAWLHVPHDVKILPHQVKVPSSLLRM